MRRITKDARRLLEELPKNVTRLVLTVQLGITSPGGAAGEGEAWGPTIRWSGETHSGRIVSGANFRSSGWIKSRQYESLVSAARTAQSHYWDYRIPVEVNDTYYKGPLGHEGELG